MENIKIDNNSMTQIKINIDNKKVNHAALNKLLKELEDLQTKYAITFVKDGDKYVR